MKNVIGVYHAPKGHWVGNGFPVRSLFSYDTLGKSLSPFLLLDRAGPTEFEPTKERRGVDQHPHRGFETVTIVYEGEVAHKDSTGQGGVIGPGDVQWMTAGSGILHEEYHSQAFGQKGGSLNMVQLWVNLPAKHKMSPPSYQGIENNNIPSVPLKNNSGTARLIAGEYLGKKGPANTFTPMTILDLRLKPGVVVDIPAPQGWTTAIVVLHGSIQINGDTAASEADLVVLEQSQHDFSIAANSDATVLILSGEPIDEPIVGYGPFVMNTKQEIESAIQDFKSGQFGSM